MLGLGLCLGPKAEIFGLVLHPVASALALALLSSALALALISWPCTLCPC